MIGENMKKTIVTIFIIMNCLLKLNAQSLDGLVFEEGSDGPSPFIYFEENTISLGFPKLVIINGDKYVDLEEISKSTYSYNIVNGIYHITIPSNPKIELFLLFNDEFGYFSITSPDNYKYDSDLLLRITEKIKPSLPRGGGEPYIVSYIGEIRASSFLTENRREYRALNLNKLFTSLPWVEGKAGAGIGEYIEYDFSKTYTYLKTVDTFIMSNGYFSPSNPNLYYQNNRVKRIKIEDLNGSYKQEFEVLDTPNLQIFKLNKSYSKLRITILDVYNGTDYNDTCINYLVGVRYLFNRP
jgi:hypothetical protein